MKKIRQTKAGTSLLFKFDLKMRLSIVCLLIPLLGIQAKTSYAQKVVSLNYDEISISDLLDTLENKSDYRFVYKVKDVDLDRKLSVSANKEEVENLVTHIFKETDVNPQFFGDQIFLDKKLKSDNSIADDLVMDQQDPIKITGTVTDGNGVPLPGVNITIEGTSKGTSTDFDGNYEIEAEEGQKLVFSSVGFEDQAVEVGDEVVDIQMQEGSALDEVVVVGYGTTRKEDLSTSVSAVKIDQSIKSGQSDLSTAIQGRLPGVTFQSGGGDPLKEGTLSIRGRGSRGSDGDPSSGDGVLYVVDGVPNAPFNVADIESVSVLKDAASAAIYGANVGSGGVIEISTKQAQSGKARINFNTYQGVKKVADLPKTLDSQQYIDVWNRAIDDMPLSGNASLPMVADPNKYGYGTATRTDWLDEVFRSAYQQHYDFNITGGTEQLKALGSFAYDKNEGTLINTYMERLNAKLNVDYKISDWIKISENIDYEHSKGQGDLNNNTHEGIIMNAVFFPRSATIYEYDEAGNQLFDGNNSPRYGGTIPQYLADQGVSGFGEIRNPVASLRRLNQYRPTSRIYSTSKLELNPLDNLIVLSRYTVGIQHSRDESFEPRIPEVGRPDNENKRTVSSSQGTNWEWETTATYSSEINSHKIDGLIGFNMAKENYRYTSISVFDFDKEDRNSTIFPSGDNYAKERPEEEIWDEAKTSVFGRIGYSYANRYFLTTSLRRDATSKLFRENNSGIFPSVSGSWKISSEQFFETIKERLAINVLKFRGSWGQIGNIKLVPRYSYDAPLAFPDWPYILGENLDNEVYGVYQQTLSNPDLKWETTEQAGVGIDLTLFNRILDISVDYYHKTTKDLIEQLPPPSVAGVELPPYGNVGNVLNEGWEFSMAYNRSFGNLDFNIWGNFNTVTNTVKSFGDQGFMAHDIVMNGLKPLRSKVGEPWYSYYLIETDGIFQSQEEIDNYINANGEKIQPNAVPGDLKFIDHNGDGKISDDDKVYHGSYLPKITYAFGANFNYKGFDLGMMFQGVSNVKIYNGFKQMGLNGRDAGNNMLSDVLKSWNYDKNSGIPRLSIAGDENENYGKASDFFLESGSYLRMKKLTLGYTLSERMLSSIGLEKTGLRIYLNAENLFTITPYTGIDPEVGNFGLDGGNYPVARSFSIGLNLNL